jgi:hypothetical protein
MKHDQQVNWAQNASLGENDGPREPDSRLIGYRSPGYILCLLEMYGMGKSECRNTGFQSSLEGDGLVDGNLLVTPKGRAYIEMLCRTPLPVMLWADPREAK